MGRGRFKDQTCFGIPRRHTHVLFRHLSSNLHVTLTCPSLPTLPAVRPDGEPLRGASGSPRQVRGQGPEHPRLPVQPVRGAGARVTLASEIMINCLQLLGAPLGPRSLPFRSWPCVVRGFVAVRLRFVWHAAPTPPLLCHSDDAHAHSCTHRSAGEIAAFAAGRGARFHVMGKVDVNGPRACETYRFLKVQRARQHTGTSHTRARGVFFFFWRGVG